MQSDDLGLAAKPVLWRYRNHDINGDPWPWSYTEREPAPGSYAEIEPLCRAAAIERLVAERDEARASWQEAVTMYQSEAERVDPAISALLAAKEALRPLAVLEVPAFRPKGNAGFYSIRFDDIARARQALRDAP